MIKTIIYGLLGITIVGVLIFIIGFGGAFWITYNEPTTTVIEPEVIEGEIPNEEEVEDTIETYRILVLGDSLAKGTGDETSLGYSGHLKESLNDFFETVDYKNLGIDGLVSQELLELIENPEVLDAIEEANLILISINTLKLLLFHSCVHLFLNPFFHG